MKSDVIKLMDYSPVASCSIICEYDESKHKKKYDNKLCQDYSECKENSENKDISKCEKKQCRLGICKQIQEQISDGKYNIVTLFEDKKEKKNSDEIKVFDIYQNEYRTKKYVGIIKGNIETQDVTITIGSRFDSELDQKFLNYVFSKAFDSTGKIFRDMNPTSTPEKMWDVLLMYLFIDQLELAFRQGNYRKYMTFEYNDSKLKGKIDVTRHIRLNPIQNGKIAYSTREYSVNNPINQLILLTYDNLKKKYGRNFEDMINKNKTIKDGIQNLQGEIPNYKNLSKRDVLNKSLKPINQLMYMNYENIRKTSITILRRLGLNIYNQNSNEVNGVLIAMDKLWETFLNNVIFKELQALTQENIEILIGENSSKGKRTIIPDFYSKERGYAFDAKYKVSWGNSITSGNTKKWDSKTREDVFQILAYMLTLDVKIGGIIFPLESFEIIDANDERIKIDGYKVSNNCEEHNVYTIPYKIPTNIKSVSDFNLFLDNQNKQIIIKINEIINKYNKGIQEQVKKDMTKEIKDLTKYKLDFKDIVEIINNRKLTETEKQLINDEKFISEIRGSIEN